VLCTGLSLIAALRTPEKVRRMIASGSLTPARLFVFMAYFDGHLMSEIQHRILGQRGALKE
jgi:hypothetical protein